MPSKTAAEDFFKGLWLENPIFRQMLGMCPTLAVTNTVINGLAMGLATSFVLVFSSFLISLIKKFIPNQVRIASYIVVIASFVTIADRFLAAYFWDISKALGPFVPLIVVNCIILGRAEAFASKNTVGRSVIDALGMSAGFILALLVLSSIREILGSGRFLGYRILGTWFEPWIIMVLPAGAFITLGVMMAISIQVERKRKGR
ncbi:MAG: electron transport complex subunit E [Clostridiales bacterium]|nr:electron transport complex subunit E [Clostridiales bacterium]